MSKHTPGPWRWEADGAGPEDEWGCRTRASIDPREFKSGGYCYNPVLYGADGTPVISAGAGEYTPFQNPEDAVLIQHAPAMLAALRAFLSLADVGRVQQRYGEVNLARAIVKTVEGEQ